MKLFTIVFCLLFKNSLCSEQAFNQLTSYVDFLKSGEIKNVTFESKNCLNKKINLNVGKFDNWKGCTICNVKKNIYVKININDEFKYFCLECSKEQEVLNTIKHQFLLKFNTNREKDGDIHYVVLSKSELVKLKDINLYLFTIIPETKYYNLYICNLPTIFDVFKKSSMSCLTVSPKSNHINNDSITNIYINNENLYLNKHFYNQKANTEVCNYKKFSLNSIKSPDNICFDIDKVSSINQSEIDLNNDQTLIKSHDNFINVDEVVYRVKNVIILNKIKNIDINEVISSEIVSVTGDKLKHDLLEDLIKSQLYSDEACKPFKLLIDSTGEIENAVRELKENFKIHLVSDKNTVNKIQTRPIIYTGKTHIRHDIKKICVNFNIGYDHVFSIKLANLNLKFSPFMFKTLFPASKKMKKAAKFKFHTSKYDVLKEKTCKPYIKFETFVNLENSYDNNFPSDLYFFIIHTILNIYNFEAHNKSLVYDVIYGPKNLPFMSPFYRQVEALKGCSKWLRTQNIKVKYIENSVDKKKFMDQTKKIFDCSFTDDYFKKAINQFVYNFCILRATKYVIIVFFVTDKKIDSKFLIAMLKKEFRIEEKRQKIEKKMRIKLMGKNYFVCYYELLLKRNNKDYDFFNSAFLNVKNELNSLCSSNFLKIKIEIRCLEKGNNMIRKRKRSN